MEGGYGAGEKATQTRIHHVAPYLLWSFAICYMVAFRPLKEKL
jgi:hypothetical protein